MKRVEMRRTIGQGCNVSLDAGSGKIEGKISLFPSAEACPLTLNPGVVFSSLLGELES